MTTTVTTAESGPLIANGTSALPFTFQAISASEIEVTRNGVVASPSTYVVNLNPDSTGIVTPVASWGSDFVMIRSAPNYGQPFQFERFIPLYPDQLNAPLDRQSRTMIALRQQLLTSVRAPAGEVLATLPALSLRAGRWMGFDSSGDPTVVTSDALAAALSPSLGTEFKGDPGSDGEGHGTRASLAAAADTAANLDDTKLNAAGLEGDFVYDATSAAADITAFGAFAATQTLVVPDASTPSGANGAYHRPNRVLPKTIKGEWLLGVSTPAETDCHIPLQRALVKLRDENGGGTLQLPPYLVNFGGNILNNIGVAAMTVGDNIDVIGNKGSHLHFAGATEDVTGIGVHGSNVTVRDFTMSGLRNVGGSDRPFLLYIGTNLKSGASEQRETDNILVEDMIFQDTDTAIRIPYNGWNNNWVQPDRVRLNRITCLNIGYQAIVPEGDDITIENFHITADPTRPLRGEHYLLRVIGCKRPRIRNGTIHGRTDTQGYSVQTAGVGGEFGVSQQYRDCEDVDILDVHLYNCGARFLQWAGNCKVRGGSVNFPLSATNNYQGAAIGSNGPEIEGRLIFDGFDMTGVPTPYFAYNNNKHIVVRNGIHLSNSRTGTGDCYFLKMEREGGVDLTGATYKSPKLVEVYNNSLLGYGSAYDGFIGALGPSADSQVRAWHNHAPALGAAPFFRSLVVADGRVFNGPADSAGTLWTGSPAIGQNSMAIDDAMFAAQLADQRPSPRSTQF